MPDILYLVCTWYGEGHRLEMLRAPSDYLPLPSPVLISVRDVKSLDTSLGLSHIHWMELSLFCFAEGHEWWVPWKSEVGFR